MPDKSKESNGSKSQTNNKTVKKDYRDDKAAIKYYSPKPIPQEPKPRPKEPEKER